MFLIIPNLLDCTVFGTFGVLMLLYISRGEDSWNACDITNHPLLVQSKVNITFSKTGPDFTSPVFHNGAFYCLGDQGRLGVFNPKEEILWRVLDRPEEPCTDAVDEIYLMECDGKLDSVFVGKVGKWVSVFMLNELEMCWEKVDDLGDYVLFVSYSSSFSAKKAVNGMENKVYFPRFYRGEGLVCSLKTNKLESFGGKRSRKDFYNTKYLMNSCWIEPSSDKHTAMELDWIRKSQE